MNPQDEQVYWCVASSIVPARRIACENCGCTVTKMCDKSDPTLWIKQMKEEGWVMTERTYWDKGVHVFKIVIWCDACAEPLNEQEEGPSNGAA